MKFAAIDIGSNAIRLLISDIIQKEKGNYPKKNTLIRVPLRLGDDAFLEKKLSEKKIQDLIKTLSAFKNLIEVYKVQKYKAYATSALRECENGVEIINRIQNDLRVEVEIIDGYREAKLIYSSLTKGFLDEKKNYLCIDVGGGSTELSLFVGNQLEGSKSFNIGTIRILDNKDREEEWRAMQEWIRFITQGITGIEAIGTGGNINKLYRIAQEKEGFPLSKVRLINIYKYLSSFSLKDRINILELKQDRADVILPAAEIFISICKWGRINQIHVPKSGLVDGIVQNLIDETFSN